MNSGVIDCARARRIRLFFTRFAFFFFFPGLRVAVESFHFRVTALRGCRLARGHATLAALPEYTSHFRVSFFLGPRFLNDCVALDRLIPARLVANVCQC